MNDPAIVPGVPPSNRYGPVTPSQMFERTAALLRENPKLFFGIVLVVIAVEIVVNGVTSATSGIALGNAATIGRAALTRLFFLAPLYLLGLVLIYVFTQIVQGALFLAAQARMANTPITVGDAWRLAAEKGGRLIGISILVFLRILGYMVLFYVPFLTAITLTPGIARRGGGAGAFHLGYGGPSALVIGFGIFVLAFFVLCIWAFLWLTARYSVSIPAALAENAPILEAIRRSIHLTRGSKGRLYALYIGTFLIYFVIVAFMLPIELLIVHRTGQPLAVAAGTFSAGQIVLGVLYYIVFAIVLAIVGIGVTVCYYDLRVRKEGFGGTADAPAVQIPSVPPAAAGDWPVEDLPIS